MVFGRDGSTETGSVQADFSLFLKADIPENTENRARNYFMKWESGLPNVA